MPYQTWRIKMKTSANAWRIVVVATLVLLIALFAIYVWPTRYRYDQISTGQYAVYLRVDRFTGEASRLDLKTNTWITAKTLADQEAELKRSFASPTPTPENPFDKYIRERQQNQQSKK